MRKLEGDLSGFMRKLEGDFFLCYSDEQVGGDQLDLIDSPDYTV